MNKTNKSLSPKELIDARNMKVWHHAVEFAAALFIFAVGIIIFCL